MSNSVLLSTINQTIDFITNYQFDEITLDTLLQKYYTLNDIPLKVLSPVNKDYKSPFNHTRDNAFQRVWKSTNNIFKLKLQEKRYIKWENHEKYDEKLKAMNEEFSKEIIDPMWKTEITDTSQSGDILVKQYVTLLREFGNIENIKILRKLYSCNDMNEIILKYKHFDTIIDDTIRDQKQVLILKSQIFTRLNGLKPRHKLYSLAKTALIFKDLNELLAFGSVRRDNKEMNQHGLYIPDGIRLMIRMFYQGLTFFDKIIHLISDSLNSMDDLKSEVVSFEHFYMDLNWDEPTDFYVRFQKEITGIFERFGNKSMNEFLANAEENPSFALNKYATKLQEFYMLRCKKQNSEHLELTYNEKILRLFVDTVSTKYKDGYDNMIFDIDNGYEDLTSDLKADISKIYKLFKRLDVGEAKKINEAYKQY